MIQSDMSLDGEGLLKLLVFDCSINYGFFFFIFNKVLIFDTFNGSKFIDLFDSSNFIAPYLLVWHVLHAHSFRLYFICLMKLLIRDRIFHFIVESSFEMKKFHTFEQQRTVIFARICNFKTKEISHFESHNKFRSFSIHNVEFHSNFHAHSSHPIANRGNRMLEYCGERGTISLSSRYILSSRHFQQ